jgi:hypothetical protein
MSFLVIMLTIMVACSLALFLVLRPKAATPTPKFAPGRSEGEGAKGESGGVSDA